jgi:hypothetical protein
MNADAIERWVRLGLLFVGEVACHAGTNFAAVHRGESRIDSCRGLCAAPNAEEACRECGCGGEETLSMKAHSTIVRWFVDFR